MRGPGRVGLRGAGTAGSVAALAVVAALVVPAVLPALGDGVIGTGRGGGARAVTTYNPITQLRGTLSLQQPRDVLRYTTDDPRPDYLRLTTLGTYDGGGWRQDELKGNQRDSVADPIPAPPGVAPDQPTRSVTSRLTVLSLQARWLPTPATPVDVTIDGPWLWDPASQTIYSTQTQTDKTRPYEVTSSRVIPDPSRLVASGRGLPAAVAPYAGPLDATPEVRRLTAEAIGNATTDYAKALALQTFFKDPSFTYSLQPESNGDPDALQGFLESRVGFCQQYSTAMAVMLRLSGIPSRVAVGFTAGEKQPDGSWLVTTRAAHAWPEAWIAGAGWTRFEPTPAAAGNGVATPSFTDPDGAVVVPDATPTASAGPTPSAGPAARPDRPTRALDVPVISPGGGSGSGGPPLTLLLVVAGVLLLLALPQLTQQAHRSVRWRRAGRTARSGGASGAAEAAWAQVGDDARDAGHPLEPTLSPRQAADRLRLQSRLPASAAPALAEVVRGVEQTRYARHTDLVPDGLRATTGQVRRGLRQESTKGRQVLVVLLPPSWVHRCRRSASGAVARGRAVRQGWGRAARARFTPRRS